MEEKRDNMHEEMRNFIRPENYKKKHMGKKKKKKKETHGKAINGKYCIRKEEYIKLAYYQTRYQ